MAMSAREIELAIRAALPDADVTITDLAGDGDHYAATVVSPVFSGMSRVQQHQMVYKALKGKMGGELHALASSPGAGVVMSGGQIDQALPRTDTRLLRWDGGSPTEACRSNIDGDGDGLAGCAGWILPMASRRRST